MFFSILYFFVVILGLGYTLKRLLNLKGFQDVIEETIFLIGLGLSSFVLISIPLGLTRLLYWYLFLIIALIIPVYDIFAEIKKKRKVIFRLPKEDFKIYIILGLIALTFLAVYLKGAFSYSYLEDDDPWQHAEAAKYVAIEHTYIQPSDLPIHYLEPYPPFYSVMMGVLHQTAPESIQWVLKFFNVLLVSLGLLFAYIWLKKFTNSNKIAVVSVFLLAVIPCFMSHFIWAQTLSLILWFPALYSIEKIKEEKNKKWLWAAVLTTTPILLIQPLSAAVFGIFYLVYLAIELAIRLFKFNPRFQIFKTEPVKSLIVAGFLSIIIALSIYWVPEIIFRGWEDSGNLIGFTFNGMFSGKTSIDTSGGIIYGLKDFIVPPPASKIDQPIGIGEAVFSLLIFSIIIVFLRIKKLVIEGREYLIISLIWLGVAILGTEGNALPFKLFPHRFWVFLAIPVAIITAFGIIFIYDFTKKRKLICYFVFPIIFVSIIITSGYPKYKFETSSMWSSGVGWTSAAQLAGYVNLKKLPSNTLVYSLCKNPKTVIGMDKMDYPWIKEIEDYKNYAIFDSLDNNYSFLRKYNYSYLIVDVGCVNQLGVEKIDTINKKLEQVNSSKYFSIASQLSNNNFFLYKILKD